MRRAILLVAALMWCETLSAEEARPPADAARPVGDEAKAADVRKLLELTGATRLGRQALDTFGEAFKKAHPDVPPALWSEILAEFHAEELTELVVPIYMKHLSADDVRALLAFYESPIGQKLVSVQPQILQESMAVGQAWGVQCAGRALKRLKEKGYSGKAAAD